MTDWDDPTSMSVGMTAEMTVDDDDTLRDPSLRSAATSALAREVYTGEAKVATAIPMMAPASV